ncbi:MAG: homocitrate synthase family protein [Anaerolineae bacterium]|nr:MAG: homocitrate synthase family protein [Anaerolineae bacterium]
MEGTRGMDLIYDWNTEGPRPQYPAQVFITDETLRDGLQSPSITHPSIQDKVFLLYLMRDLKIDIADLGLCGAGERFKKDVTILAKEIADQNIPIQPQSAARTLESDITPIIDASQEAGIAIEAAVFLGSSPLRQYAEGWDLGTLLKLTREAVTLAVDNGLTVMFVTEDTTRAQPDHLRQVYSEAMRAGAGRICVADTVGHATPEGVRSLIRFIAGVRDEVNPKVGIDWHGHRDRGMGLANTFAAIEAGADRVHACALGIGERSGNTPMEVLLVNLNLLGIANRDLSRLPEYCKVVSETCGAPIPFNYPIVGADSFRTSTGVHAAAIMKAMSKGDDWLVERVYCGVPADLVGRKSDIEIGPMSGEANVRYWLESRGIEVNPMYCEKILGAAKSANTLLEEDMILRMVAVMRERMQSGEDVSVDDLAVITENGG